MKIGILGSGMIVPTHADTVKIVDGIEDVVITTNEYFEISK